MIHSSNYSDFFQFSLNKLTLVGLSTFILVEIKSRFVQHKIRFLSFRLVSSPMLVFVISSESESGIFFQKFFLQKMSSAVLDLLDSQHQREVRLINSILGFMEVKLISIINIYLFLFKKLCLIIL